MGEIELKCKGTVPYEKSLGYRGDTLDSDVPQSNVPRPIIGQEVCQSEYSLCKPFLSLPRKVSKSFSEKFLE